MRSRSISAIRLGTNDSCCNSSAFCCCKQPTINISRGFQSKGNIFQQQPNYWPFARLRYGSNLFSRCHQCLWFKSWGVWRERLAQGLKVVKLCSWGGLPSQLFRHFCCRTYHLATMHSVTDRQTDNSIMQQYDEQKSREWWAWESCQISSRFDSKWWSLRLFLKRRLSTKNKMRSDIWSVPDPKTTFNDLGLCLKKSPQQEEQRVE